MDIEHFRRMDPKEADEADTKAREIKQKYFNKKYFFGPNSPATRDGLDYVSYVKYYPACYWWIELNNMLNHLCYKLIDTRTLLPHLHV